MAWATTRTEQAEEDLLAIWDHIAADNPIAADRLIHTLSDLFEKTADLPRIGRAADEIGADLRILTRGSYLPIYRLLADEKVVELVRVVHGARNWPTLFDN